MSIKEKSSSNDAPPIINLSDLPSKCFKLKDFELKIYQGEKSIIFHITEKEDFSGSLYKAELTFDELTKLNTIFTL